ncbi:hypothetical protein N8157_04210 [Burkholderiales bacterium]|jgi:hypothetical protein|nr:hypothetical protein [Burkholderiales bacterium]
MKDNHYLEQQFEEILSRVKFTTPMNEGFDTSTVLYELATTSKWCEAEFEHVDFLSKRFDITKKLFASYLNNGRIASDAEITDNACLELLAAIFLKAVHVNQDNFPVEVRLKRFNTLFKAIDLIKPNWLLPESKLGIEMESAWHTTLEAIAFGHAYNEVKITSHSTPAIQDDMPCEVIPLTVLFYEGPIARAYLALLKGLGFKPEKIIELVAAKDIATKKIVGKWLPEGLRSTYASSIQRKKIHYWPKYLSKKTPDFVSNILAEVQIKLGFEKSIIDNANALLPLSSYSNCIESILIEGLADKVLQQYLLEEPTGTILYTGGGIVPAALLDLQHLKFLHIHPGFLPDIRGADCTLWSSLLTGHTSATCFYMSPGIDTGDIVESCWLPALSFDVDVTGIDLQSMYRVVYGFLDPWIRAFVLRRIINDNTKYDSLASLSQSEVDSTTFNFMHPRLQDAAFQKLFKRS